MQTKDPDQQLWQRAQQRDEAAFEQLRQKYSILVNAEIRKRTLYGINHEDLQDMAQVVWIAVWKALPNFNGRSCFSTWLVAITKNAVFNWLRSRKTEKQAVVNVMEEIRSESSTYAGSRFVDVPAIQVAMNRLGPTEREVIRLRYFGQLSDDEVATRLELPLGTIKTRIRAGLGKLKAVMQAA